MKPTPKKSERESANRLVEGIDFYFENNLMVLTAAFLRKRGYCCSNNCRHCPYQKKEIGLPARQPE